jgi:carbamoyl-phosphate synthase large subunit
VIVQFGGQTPLNLAEPLRGAGVPIIGTSPDSIDLAEDRERFQALLERLGLKPAGRRHGPSEDEARRGSPNRIGYPVLVRPSYVLGGRAMEIVYDEPSLRRYMAEAVEASPERPVLVDRFLEGAIEVDVDAVSRRRARVVGGIMEHIEEAGVHSGDSACALPPTRCRASWSTEIERQTKILADALEVRGLMNVQFAVKDERGVRPRGEPARQPDRALRQQGHRRAAGEDRGAGHGRHPAPRAGRDGDDPAAGRLGEGAGLPVPEVPRGRPDARPGDALHRRGDGVELPEPGNAVFVSVRDEDKQAIVYIGHRLHALGFKLVATAGTAEALRERHLPVDVVSYIGEGERDILALLRNREAALVVNTPSGKRARKDEPLIRSTAIAHGVPCVTTISGAAAVVRGLEALRQGTLDVVCLQERVGG